jgi:hypothetical protein
VINACVDLFEEDFKDYFWDFAKGIPRALSFKTLHVKAKILRYCEIFVKNFCLKLLINM